MDLPRGFGAFLATVAALGGAIAFAVRAPFGGAVSEELLVWLPAAVCLVVWFLLHRFCSRGSRLSRAGATGIVAVALAFCAIAVLSIGPLLLPVALLLLVALLATPGPRAAA